MNPSWAVSRAIWSTAALGERKSWAIGWTVVPLALCAVFSFADAISPMARISACPPPERPALAFAVLLLGSSVAIVHRRWNNMVNGSLA